jgi:[FeFe] hydrogenase H-cluster maturation GTPase HydF
MNTTPKGLRLHIGIFGRTNVGKSSFLNMVAGQDVAITSSIPGTTTDVVEKTMELLPVGPVVFLDTAGLDDSSELSGARIGRARRVYERADVITLLVEPEQWTVYETTVLSEAKTRGIPVIIAVNKTDLHSPSAQYLKMLRGLDVRYFTCSSADHTLRNGQVNELKRLLLEVVPEGQMTPPPLLGDLLPPKGLVVLIVPIDLEAPKGRIILPQVQAVRDALDNGQGALVVKESEYRDMLRRLSAPPDLVVCDSQVVEKMVAETPIGVKCTTFSILLARMKGDLDRFVRGARAIDSLRSGDRVLIAESCSHHAVEDDIGRVKIPRWLREYTRADLRFTTMAGRDFPPDIADYKLIVQCGGCMQTRREIMGRIQQAAAAGVPITNYGVAIAFVHGLLDRVLEPFKLS